MPGLLNRMYQQGYGPRPMAGAQPPGAPPTGGAMPPTPQMPGPQPGGMGFGGNPAFMQQLQGAMQGAAGGAGAPPRVGVPNRPMVPAAAGMGNGFIPDGFMHGPDPRHFMNQDTIGGFSAITPQFAMNDPFDPLMDARFADWPRRG